MFALFQKEVTSHMFFLQSQHVLMSVCMDGPLCLSTLAFVEWNNTEKGLFLRSKNRLVAQWLNGCEKKEEQRKKGKPFDPVVHSHFSI